MVGIVVMVVVEVKITLMDSWVRGWRLGIALVPRLDGFRFKGLSLSSFVFGCPVDQW